MSRAELEHVSRIGGLLGIKTSSLLARLAPVARECRDDLVMTIPHTFDTLSVTTHAARDAARSLCGEWLDALAGDRLELEIDASSITARSDEAALPEGSPDLVSALGAGELAAVGYDGSAWTYVIEQRNADATDTDATIARIERVAGTLGVTDAQRRIASGLHGSLARGMTSRAWVRSRAGVLDPVLGLAWERVEWLPVQHMLTGFYPSLDAVEKIARLSRATDVDHVTVELLLGPKDPPALRIAVRLAGS